MTVPEICATSWEQLKADRAALLLQRRDALVQAIADEELLEAGRLKALIVHMLCNHTIFKRLSAVQITDIADDLKFLQEPWYDFHVTYIKTKLCTIRRPAIKLSSFTFWQLIQADSEYSKFLVLNFRKAKEQEYTLNRLIAVLYQPEPGMFIDNLVDANAMNLPKGLTLDLKYLILHTYSNCRMYIMRERCPTLFPEPEGTSLPDRQTGETLAPAAPAPEPQHTGPMWQDMLFDLSETPAFAGLENAKNARMYDALDYCEKKAKEALNNKR